MNPLTRDTILNVAKCSTAPQLYSVFIKFARHATPDDVSFLKNSDIQFPAPFKSNVDKLFDMLMAANTELRAFRWQRIHPNISLYTSPKSVEHEAGGKSVVLAFSGKAQLLMMPTAAILQYFDPAAFDFIILRDPTAMAFSAGIGEYAKGFEELLKRLDRDFTLSRYKSIRVMGTSSGGAAALAAGKTLGASSAVCFGGQLPTASQFTGKHPDAIALENIIRRRKKSKCQLFCVFGADFPPDVNSAADIAAVCRVRLVPIRDCASHVSIYSAFLQGTLADVFRDVGLTE